MVPPASWLRRVAAAASWLAVTTIAAIGSWLGMSAVFAGHSHPAKTDLLVSDTSPPPAPETDDPAPTPSDAPPITTREFETSPSPTPTTESPTPSPTPSETESTTPIDTWYPVTEDTYEGTFGTEGGTTTVQVNPTQALVVSASPANGYTVDVEILSTEELIIYFVGQDSVVTVEVWWENGPTAKITTMN